MVEIKNGKRNSSQEFLLRDAKSHGIIVETGRYLFIKSTDL